MNSSHYILYFTKIPIAFGNIVVKAGLNKHVSTTAALTESLHSFQGYIQFF